MANMIRVDVKLLSGDAQTHWFCNMNEVHGWLVGLNDMMVLLKGYKFDYIKVDGEKIDSFYQASRNLLKK